MPPFSHTANPGTTPRTSPPAPTSEAADKIKAEGNALYKKKDFDGALAKYEEALKADPTHVVIMLNKAAVYAEQRNYGACFAVSVGVEELRGGGCTSARVQCS